MSGTLDLSLSLLSVILFVVVKKVLGLNANPLLLLVSLDGYRFDLLSKSRVPHFYEFASSGVIFTNGIRSQYLTFTAPNHVSIATGLTEQNHGVVANVFYHPSTKSTFDVFNSSGIQGIVNKTLNGPYFRGEPIWLTNERNLENRRSASLYWPTADAYWPNYPHKPSVVRIWNDYTNLTQWMAEFDEIISLYTHPDNPVNFVAWYIPEPDHVLHDHGFFDGALDGVLHSIDLLFEYIERRLSTEQSLRERLNIIITSDHGHAQIKSVKSIFCIRDFIGIDGMEIGDRMIYVSDRKRRNEIYHVLRKAVKEGGYQVNVYLKEEFPSRFSYARSESVGDIILEPLAGSSVTWHCDPKKQREAVASMPFHHSTHGISPDHWTMRGILVMKGTAFQSKIKVSEIPDNIDLYPLMCYVLGINPAPNDGNMHNVGLALREMSRNSSFASSYLKRS